MSTSLMHHRGRRQGNYAVIFGLSMVTILGFAALAVDVSYIRLSALQAQNAADAGAHAAMLAYRSTLDESDSILVAESVVAMNVVAGSSVVLDTSQDIEFGGWDYNDPDPAFDPSAAYVNAAQVTVRRTDANTQGPVDLLLAPIFGRDVADVVAVATGALRFREVMLALDITPSFEDEFPQAQQAVLTFLDGMWRGGAAWPGDQIGMVTYLGEGVVWTSLDYVDAAYATIESQWSGDLDWCNQDYFPYDGTLDDPHTAPAMINCTHPETPSNTTWQSSGANPGDGISLAANELLTNGNSTALKYIIMVADGGADCPNAYTAQGGSCTLAGRMLNGIIQANQAANNNISIHTVYMNNQGSSPSATLQENYIENLARGYGRAYSTNDENELPGIMEEIVALIPVALVQ